MSVYQLNIGFRQTPGDLEGLLLAWGFRFNQEIAYLAEPTIGDIARVSGIDHEEIRVYDWMVGDTKTIEARYSPTIEDGEHPFRRIDPEISSELNLEIWDMVYREDMFAIARAVRDKYHAILHDANSGRVIRD